MHAPSHQAHSRFVSRMFADIVPMYDGLNTVFSLGIDSLWRKRLARAVGARPGDCVLDLAAGTLKVSAVLRAMYPETKVLAMDFCQPMLEKGLAGGGLGPQNIFLPAVADALALPLADNSVHAITVAFGLRNMRPRQGALQEMFRVLKPGGKLCVLELGSTQERIMLGVYNLYLEKLMPAVASVFFRRNSAYRYLAESIAAFPPAQAVKEEMEAVGFCRVTFSRMTAGIVCLHEGMKEAPCCSGI